MNPTRSANKTDTIRSSTTSAEVDPGGGAEAEVGAAGRKAPLGARPPAAAIGAPHSLQNFSVAPLANPHVGHTCATAAPHSPQNLLPGTVSARQFVQTTCAPPLEPLTRPEWYPPRPPSGFSGGSAGPGCRYLGREVFGPVGRTLLRATAFSTDGLAASGRSRQDLGMVT